MPRSVRIQTCPLVCLEVWFSSWWIRVWFIYQLASKKGSVYVCVLLAFALLLPPLCSSSCGVLFGCVLYSQSRRDRRCSHVPWVCVYYIRIHINKWTDIYIPMERKRSVCKDRWSAWLIVDNHLHTLFEVMWKAASKLSLWSLWLSMILLVLESVLTVSAEIT